MFKEDKLVGVDLDGDGVAELGESVSIKGVEQYNIQNLISL